MSHITSPSTRKYQRSSKSPWDDCSTVLLLADIVDTQAPELSYTNYIYLHRGSVGQVLGISISSNLLETNSDFSGRYLEGVEMYAFLLLHIELITKFCTLFEHEFEALFMMKPALFFVSAEGDWLNFIEKM